MWEHRENGRYAKEEERESERGTRREKVCVRERRNIGAQKKGRYTKE